MAAATDVTQRLREAIVEAFDTHAGIVAITGRASGNVVPWQDIGEEAPPSEVPRVNYQIISGTEDGGTGDAWSCLLQFSAFAATRSAASALVEVISRNLTGTLLKNLTTASVDARRTNRQRRDGGYDPDTKHYREDADITLVVQQP